MKLTGPILLLLCVLQVAARQQMGNPRYDFPDSIVAKNGKERGYLNANLNGLSISGHYRESWQYEDSLSGPPPVVRLSMAGKEVVDARKLILEKASDYRILLINEGHAHPEHRLFTKSLLSALYKQGYRIFMAEDIGENNTIMTRQYPVSTDGVLVNEPAYASLIRYALKTGYKVAAYDFLQVTKKSYWDDSVKLDRNGSMKFISYVPRDSLTIMLNEKGEVTMTYLTSVREKSQADNINKVLNSNPGAKAIIHVGHGHLYESGSWMGAQLRALLNQEDILTIDQQSTNIKVPIIDTLTHDTIRMDFAWLLWMKDKQRFFNTGLSGGGDYTVINAAIKDALGRPGFLFQDPEPRQVYNIPATQLKDCPCLFSAYYADEYSKSGADAIAVDIVYSKSENNAPPLLLYKGKYQLIKKNRQGGYTRSNLDIHR
ncbi:hypothetical protein [uncultured Chitinophaga sp.]|uniref:hypothetical protein n=1 Tax=uncultured Chitinophaga sp. TaxID=339340 RepID=UPI00262E13A8|nr:hypothetical protein [uncultured Chitinophaga sp.]